MSFLSPLQSNGHLRDLLLQLLVGSAAIEQLKDDLHQILLEPNESENTRLLANRCLLDINNGIHRSDLDCLISEASNTSLDIAIKIIETQGSETFERAYLAKLLRACSNLYSRYQEYQDGAISARYFLKKFIKGLDLATTKWLLDKLTKELVCLCGKKPYNCDCRNGISKIIGLLLDHYFGLATPPFDSLRVWQWVGNLNFYVQKSPDQSKAVQVLQKDDELRQGIIAHVFGGLTNQDEIRNTRINKLGWYDYSHSGLNFQTNDSKFIVDLAFESNNPNLWVSFMARHDYYRTREERGPDNLRRHMREQALEKPLFMREWAKTNRSRAQQFKQDKLSSRWRVKHDRKIERRRRKQKKIHAANIKYIQDNRELVESGHHWSLLVGFAELMLKSPDKIKNEFGDEKVIQNALRNCLNFITPHVPNLTKLAKLKCASKWPYSVTILYAACLEIMRVKGNLEEVDLGLLRALGTSINMRYKAVSGEERDALFKEVHRLIFPDANSAEQFLRQYIEPQLAEGYTHPEIGLLKRDWVFNDLRATLSIEWLKRFSELELEPLNTLFEIAAEYGNPDNLKAIITKRCAEFMSNWPNWTEKEDIEQKRTFWLVRAWYFLDDVPKPYWDWLKADENTVLIFYNLSWLRDSGVYSYWPKLTLMKVEAILNAFIKKWPKVDLPNVCGTGSPDKEKAYRFLTEVILLINSDNPDDAIPVLERLLADPRFADLQNDLKSIYAGQLRKKALRDFNPPTPEEIIDLLDQNVVVTVEGLRQLVIQELEDFQKAIGGGEFNSADRFYANGERLNEEQCTEIIAERLNLRLELQGISVTKEHELKSAKRADFTVTKMIGGTRKLLVTEVKGQWHKELYTAASSQLNELYSIHPDAERQGIFLVIWFGVHEKVAGHKQHGISNAQELKSRIEAELPPKLRRFIDVFVLDVSKPEGDDKE